jgi:hypothetical protein
VVCRGRGVRFRSRGPTDVTPLPTTVDFTVRVSRTAEYDVCFEAGMLERVGDRFRDKFGDVQVFILTDRASSTSAWRPSRTVFDQMRLSTEVVGRPGRRTFEEP